MRYDNGLSEGVEVCACCGELYTQELTASEFCENCDIPDDEVINGSADDSDWNRPGHSKHRIRDSESPERNRQTVCDRIRHRPDKSSATRSQAYHGSL